MKHIVNKIDFDQSLIDQIFKDRKILFFDIETTGFSRKYNHIYLIGMLYYCPKEKSWLIHQILAENRSEERYVLKEFNSLLLKFDTLVSFNGDSFDIPFVGEKLRQHKIGSNLDRLQSYDIYRLIKPYKKLIPTENLKLKTIERFLGIYREDAYTGGDCIDFYLEYEGSKDRKLEKFILMHNYEDLYYLKDILKIISYLDCRLSFKAGDHSFYIRDVDLKKDILRVALDNKEAINLVSFDDHYRIESKKEGIDLRLYLKKAYIAEDTICSYIDPYELGLYPKNYKTFQLPDQYFILAVEKDLVLENIRSLTKTILEEILEA